MSEQDATYTRDHVRFQFSVVATLVAWQLVVVVVYLFIIVCPNVELVVGIAGKVGRAACVLFAVVLIGRDKDR